jgi:hypothetical protein
MLPLKGCKVAFGKDPQKYLQGGPTMKMPGH